LPSEAVLFQAVPTGPPTKDLVRQSASSSHYHPGRAKQPTSQSIARLNFFDDSTLLSIGRYGRNCLVKFGVERLAHCVNASQTLGFQKPKQFAIGKFDTLSQRLVTVSTMPQSPSQVIDHRQHKAQQSLTLGPNGLISAPDLTLSKIIHVSLQT
jgi:hypothetical protein